MYVVRDDWLKVNIVMAHAITVAIPTELADQPNQLVTLRAVALDDRRNEDRRNPRC